MWGRVLERMSFRGGISDIYRVVGGIGFLLSGTYLRFVVVGFGRGIGSCIGWRGFSGEGGVLIGYFFEYFGLLIKILVLGFSGKG